MIAVDYTLAVEFDSGDGTWTRARIDDDLFGVEFERFIVVIWRYLNRLVVEHLSATHKNRNLVLLVEEVSQPSILAVDHTDRALKRSLVVECRFTLEVDTELRRALDFVQHTGRLEHCLCWDAALMQACASEFEHFDNSDVQPELLRPDGGNISTCPASEQDNVVLLVPGRFSH